MDVLDFRFGLISISLEWEKFGKTKPRASNEVYFANVPAGW